MIYSLNTEVFKFHSYDIVNINKAIERFGISPRSFVGAFCLSLSKT